MKLFSLVITLLLFGALLSAQGTSRSEYYATLRFMESPFEDFAGVGRLSNSQALIQNHYRFDYDDKHRLIKVSFHSGKRPANPNFTANYFFLSHAIMFFYTDSTEVRMFQNLMGKYIAIRGNNYKEVYQINNRGFRVSMQVEDYQGQKTQHQWGIARYSWVIQEDGTVIEERFSLAGQPTPMRPDLPFYRVRFSFNSTGSLALIQHIDSVGNLQANVTGAAQDKLDYDKSGRFFGWTVLDEQGQRVQGNAPLVAQGINEPNELGYYAATHYLDVNGSRMSSAYYTWGDVTQYDKYGNQALIHFRDSMGGPGPHLREGLVYIKYQFDSRGYNMEKISFLDIHNQPFVHPVAGYAIQQNKFDSEDRTTRISYHDKNGLLINRADTNYAYIALEYDNEGRLSKQSFHQADGQLTEVPERGYAVVELVYPGAQHVVIGIRRYDKTGKPIK